MRGFISVSWPCVARPRCAHTQVPLVATHYVSCLVRTAPLAPGPAPAQAKQAPAPAKAVSSGGGSSGVIGGELGPWACGSGGGGAGGESCGAKFQAGLVCARGGSPGSPMLRFFNSFFMYAPGGPQGVG
ncbi:hypothetical protein FOA52_007290 [Chlamydomonas sp. UWO 241]|nr:hypothetical protein FOA52_007290 [Chlamydomonas sp. UWO 241]